MTLPAPEHMHTRIQELFDTLVIPAVRKDGGNIEFVKFQDGIVYVNLSGACINCPSSYFTLKLGVLELLKQQIPEVQDVMAC
jgi:Fe-S cluster biogenesis protein NfuA